MARVINEEEYNRRRSEILDTAQRLILTKGYEQMSIQDVIDQLGISKGAFYHYFSSKSGLLEASLQRTQQQAEAQIYPILQAAGMPVLEKINRFFSNVGRWKSAQKSYLMALLAVWYTDENLVVRHKTTGRMLHGFAPLMAGLIRQGVLEGVFNTAHPDQASRILLALMLQMGDEFAGLLLDPLRCHDDAAAQAIVAAYTTAFERILGAPSGSIELMDQATIRQWVAPLE
ncbi:MAG: TetR/AcrR family transcriptional regulator [Chloroflexota bacterium]